MTTDTITGTITDGVVLDSGSYTNPVTIASGASITNSVYRYGYNYSAVYAHTAWNLVNEGDISKSGYYAVLLLGGGTVTNTEGASISSDLTGIALGGPQDTVINAGSISGYYGIKIGGTNGFVDNTGTISGTRQGARITGANATLENAGTIVSTGNFAAVELYGTGSNRLIVDPGAVFTGSKAAIAKNGAGTLELGSGAASGTLSGMGARYTGFQTLTIDAGATWDVTGTVAGFSGTTIHGFSAADKLDLTDVAFNAGDTTTFNSTTDVLTIENGSGGTIGTIHFSSAYTGGFFHLTNDGHGGTFLTEDTTPCFCRGTRIRTPRGDVPVETLGIGDLVTTADGTALPLKWIGRRSYRDWLAVSDVQPILFKAGSIAKGIPARDLYVSPEHAMFLDGMLVPALHLVNGVSILKMSGIAEIDYFHLEFDRHAVVFAEGVAAESFVDDCSRMLFHNADEYRRLYPNERRHADAVFCAPRVEDGFELDALRRALALRATYLPRGQRESSRMIEAGRVTGWSPVNAGRIKIEPAAVP